MHKLLSKITLVTITLLALGQTYSLANAETTKSLLSLNKGGAGLVFKALSKADYASKLQALHPENTVTEVTQVASPEVTEVSTQVVYQTQTQAETYVDTSHQQTYANQSVAGGSIVLANGNTAGEIGSAAAAQMAAQTGVPQATWEYIIARESNGQVNAQNASGASGLFQTMPGWGSTATVEDQVQSALNAYNAQGLAAWGME